MHTSNTLYPSDVCSLSLFLSFNMDYFIFEKKNETKNDDYRCVVYIKSELSSPSSSHRERERIEKPTQYLTLTLSLTYVNNPSLNYY